MKNFQGVYAALMTPFSADGSVNYEALKTLADHCIDAGLTGLYVGGSTGEGFLLTEEERMEVFRHMREEILGRVEQFAIIIHERIGERRGDVFRQAEAEDGRVERDVFRRHTGEIKCGRRRQPHAQAADGDRHLDRVRDGREDALARHGLFLRGKEQQSRFLFLFRASFAGDAGKFRSLHHR